MLWLLGMREHALPQDVVGYRFHIIGNMTIKQFAEVAIGCALAFGVYNTNLPLILKWPMIVILAGGGAMLAFVPFEERPLDHWFTAFFRALYRPTQFFWQRTSKIPEPFLYESNEKHNSLVKEIDLTPARRQRVKEYLRSVDDVESDSGDDAKTQARLQEIFQHFSGSPAPQAYATVVVPDAVPSSPTPSMPSSDQYLEPVPEPTAESVTSTFTSPVATTPSTDNVQIPQQETITIAPSDLQLDAVMSDDQVNQMAQQAATFVDQSTISAPTADPAMQTITQNRTLPFPNRPTEPNKVVGMVVDQQDTPLQNAIVEILTADGLPARAIKTNVLGQFFITTPLANGTYTIQAEKEGFQFPALQLITSGQVIDPLEIRAA